MSKLANALFTLTQQQLLALLYGQPGRSFYVNEMLRLTGMGVATIKRELESLLAAGVLQRTIIGNQHHFQANTQCLIYSELLAIVKKTVGLTVVLRDALAPLAGKIDLAFVYGSVASGNETVGSDIDLMLVGSLDFGAVVIVLHPAQLALGREVNPKVFTKKEWQLQLKQPSSFIKEVLSKPHMDVIGHTDEPGKSKRNKPRTRRTR